MTIFFPAVGVGYGGKEGGGDGREGEFVSDYQKRIISLLNPVLYWFIVYRGFSIEDRIDVTNYFILKVHYETINFYEGLTSYIDL